MSPDILIVRDGNGYRVLHGHLHLVNALSLHGEVLVDVKGEGKVRVVRTRQDYFAGSEGQRLPVLRN